MLSFECILCQHVFGRQAIGQCIFARGKVWSHSGTWFRSSSCVFNTCSLACFAAEFCSYLNASFANVRLGARSAADASSHVARCGALEGLSFAVLHVFSTFSLACFAAEFCPHVNASFANVGARPAVIDLEAPSQRGNLRHLICRTWLFSLFIT